MPPQKKRNTAPSVSSADRIGDLPDGILHHLLSFLPAQATVQTSLLARRWRHLWRSTTGLRIDDEHLGFQRLQKFVEQLLILRERTDLDTVEIKLRECQSLYHNVQHYVNLWIRFAVMCKVQVLTLEYFDSNLYLDNLPLVSRRLRTLHLHDVTLQEKFVDFASCPALEDLKMHGCGILADKISSRSLKRLSIIGCYSDLGCRLHVCTPGLISLGLLNFMGKTPFVENMALLESACVDFDSACEDFCLTYTSGVFYGANNNACGNCVAQNGGSNNCVLLGGISTARHLELQSADSSVSIYTRDLKHCPTFSKLKTLLLNEYWCSAPDLGPLACILKNSPVLEKLTLLLLSTGQLKEATVQWRDRLQCHSILRWLKSTAMWSTRKFSKF